MFKLKYIKIKRVVIVVLLTILVVGVTNGIWLQRTIELKFDAIGSGDVNFQLFYSKELKFSEKESVHNDVNLSKVDKVSILINAKKVSFVRLDFGDKPIKVALSNLSIKGKGKKLKLGLYNVEFRNIEQHSFENGILSLKSSHRDPFIVIKLPKQMKSSRSLDFMLLIVIFQISYLFFNQVVGYLAGFKIKESHSRIDIVFLCFFFGLLFVPMSQIDKYEISKKENRRLEKYVPLMLGSKLNSSYGKNFEAWFSDHFCGRNSMIELYYIAEAILSPRKGTDRVLAGLEGWLFYKPNDSIRNYQNLDVFTDDELKNISEYLQGINDWCEKNGKKFIFLIGPDKNKIYPEYYEMVNKINSDDESRSRKLINYLEKHTKVDVLYPYTQLHDLKKQGDLLYWKTDTHWNRLGAYYVYLEFMKMLPPEKYNISTYIPEKIDIEKGYKGDMFIVYQNFSQEYEPEYKIPFVKEQKCDTKIVENKPNVFCSNLEGKYKIVVFGDSFSRSLMPYLSSSFTKASLFRNYDIMENKDFINENADIVVLEMVERFLPQLKDYKFPKE